MNSKKIYKDDDSNRLNNKMDSFQATHLSFQPKVVHYHEKGNGRDSYILHNHGGMVASDKKPDMLTRTGTFLSRNSYHKPSPVVASPMVGYRSDGSGRDSYVTVNSGGLYPPYNGGNDQQRFKDSLRMEIVRNNSYCHLNAVSLKGKLMLRNQGAKVKQVTRRLFTRSYKHLTF